MIHALVPVLGLLLLAFAGYIKGSPALSFIPVDLTFLGAAVVAAAVAHRLVGERFRLPRGTGWLLLLWATFLLGLVPGEAWNPYTQVKVPSLLLVVLASAGGLLLLRGGAARTVWLKCVVVLGVFMAALALVFPEERAVIAGRLAVDGGNTIAMGRATGAAVVALVVVAMATRRHRGRSLLVAVALAAVMVWSGSRGPVAAAVIAVLVVALMTGGKGRGRRFLVGAGAAVVAAWLAVQLGIVPARLLSVDGESVGVRTDLWAVTREVIATHPFGIGWGNLRGHLPLGLSGPDWTEYPHNLLLEVTSEAGWVAGIVLVLVLAVALRRQAKVSSTPVEMAMLGLLVFYLLNAMVSADVNGNRGLWVAVGAALATTIGQPRRTTVSPNSSLYSNAGPPRSSR